ncbi:unnamed protein product, partial [Allacma fusca]
INYEGLLKREYCGWLTMSEQRNQTLVNGCHNASISTAQRRVNSGRKDVIVQSNNNLNVFSEQILEAKAQVDRKRMSARVSFQKKKNENKRKMLSLQTDAVQLQTEIDKLSSAVELVKLEEGQKIEKAHSYRMNLKKNHRSLREERK